MRKAQEDPLARTVAEHHLGDALEASGLIDSTAYEPTEVGRATLKDFAEAVQFETATSRVAGKDIRLRRLVITGPWEVDPNGGKAP